MSKPSSCLAKAETQRNKKPARGFSPSPAAEARTPAGVCTDPFCLWAVAFVTECHTCRVMLNAFLLSGKLCLLPFPPRQELRLSSCPLQLRSPRWVQAVMGEAESGHQV